MSELKQASGGDGWSRWTVERLPNGTYEIDVISRAERNADHTGKVLYHSETERHGRQAIDKAMSVSADYGHRMYT